MSLEGMSDSEIRDLENNLIAKVRENGGMMGNVTLRAELEWSEDRYWIVRNRLLDAGYLEKGRGKGGSVRLAQTNEAELTPQPGPKEADLYEPLKRALEDYWVKDQKLGRQTLVEVTASAGRKNTGGKWSRPDLVVASLTAFKFLPHRHFEIVTFEVKTTTVDVTAIYEALAHHRAATRSYVLAHIPEPTTKELDKIEEEARRHEIGFIVVEDPGNYSTWETRVDATYREPSPHELDAFIATQFSAGAKDEMLTWR